MHFWCGNIALVKFFNLFTSRTSRMMSLVYTFTLYCLRFKICFCKGVNVNGFFDALSLINRWRDFIN